MPISLALIPSMVTVRPNSAFSPSMAKIVVTVDAQTVYGTPYPYNVVLQISGVAPSGWIGTVNLNGPGGDAGARPPYTSEIDVTADPNCPIGTFGFQVMAAPYMVDDPTYSNDRAGASETVNVSLQPTRKVTIQTTLGGSTKDAPGTYSVYYGEALSVLAVPSGNNRFDHWTVNGTIVSSGTSDPTLLQVTVLADMTIKAFFVIRYQVTMQGSSNGTVSPPSGIFFVEAGQSVHLVATPNDGYWLDHWALNGVNGGNQPDWNYVPTADVTIMAVFVVRPPNQYLLTISVHGNGSTSPIVGTHPYLQFQQVTVRETIVGGSTFSGWVLDGQNVGNASSITFNMDRDRSLIAVFTGGGPSPPTDNNLLIVGAIFAAIVGGLVLVDGK